MSEAMERAVLGDQAQEAWSQFVGPAVGIMRDDYMTKLIEIASRPLDDRKRQSVDNLSMAVRVLAEVEAQLRKAMADGEAAKKEIGRASTIANMGPEARRYAGY